MFIQLPDNFFEDDKIIYLSNLKNGHAFITFFQQLLLKTLQKSFNFDENFGYLQVSNSIFFTIETLAISTRRSLKFVREAIVILQELDMLEILPDGRYNIINAAKYVAKKDSSKDRTKKWRDRKCDVTVTSHETSQVTQCDGVESIDNSIRVLRKEREERKDNVTSDFSLSNFSFEEFWGSYPQRLGANLKTEARKAWDKEIQQDDGAARLMVVGAGNYNDYSVDIKQTNTQYVIKASNFISKKEYLNYQESIPVKQIKEAKECFKNNGNTCRTSKNDRKGVCLFCQKF